jgi:hypothetical protein
MKTVNQLLDELQEAVGTRYIRMHSLSSEEKAKDEEFINSRMAKAREMLGPERMKEVEKLFRELEPKIQVIQPKQLNPTEPPRDIDGHELERYYVLKKLLFS